MTEGEVPTVHGKAVVTRSLVGPVCHSGDVLDANRPRTDVCGARRRRKDRGGCCSWASNVKTANPSPATPLLPSAACVSLFERRTAWSHAALSRDDTACGDAKTVDNTRAWLFTEGFASCGGRVLRTRKSATLFRAISKAKAFVFKGTYPRCGCNYRTPDHREDFNKDVDVKAFHPLCSPWAGSPPGDRSDRVTEVQIEGWPEGFLEGKNGFGGIGQNESHITAVYDRTIRRSMKQGSYQYEAQSINAFISQVVRLAGKRLSVRHPGPDTGEERCSSCRREGARVIRHQAAKVATGTKTATNGRRGVHLIWYDRLFVIMLTKGRHDQLYSDHGSKHAEPETDGTSGLRLFNQGRWPDREGERSPG